MFDHERARQTLIETQNADWVCGPDTDAVVEGYPRSGNTFAVRAIKMMMQKHNLSYHIAHHTHNAMNLQIGTSLNKPCIVLLRDPMDAMLSLQIYKQASRHKDEPLTSLIDQWLEFHKIVYRIRNKCTIVQFEKFSQDFNALILPLRNAGLDIPLSDSIETDQKRALNASSGMENGAEYALKKGNAPHPERDRLKQVWRSELVDLLNKDPRPYSLHKRLIEERREEDSESF